MYNLRSHLLRINLMTPIHFLTFLLLVYTLPSISLPNQIPRLAIFIVIFIYIFQFLAHNIRLFSIHSSIFRHNFYSCQVRIKSMYSSTFLVHRHLHTVYEQARRKYLPFGRPFRLLFFILLLPLPVLRAR